MNEAILIYAAGPIDLGTDLPNWRKELMLKLERQDVTAVLFDPSTAYKCANWGEVDRNRSGYIEDVNREALHHANFFVACLPQKVPSVGTPMELDWATDLGLQTLVLTDISAGMSVYLDNRVNSTQRFVCDLSDLTAVDQALNDMVAFIVKNATGPQKYLVKAELKDGELNDVLDGIKKEFVQNEHRES